MTKRKLLIALLLFLLYAALVWFAASYLFSGSNFLLVVFVLMALGLTVLIVYLLISRMRQPAAAPPPAAGQEAEKAAPVRPVSGDDPEVVALAGLLTEANTRLAKSPKLASRRARTTVTRLPLFLLGGAEGAGKTSTFLKSGLEPELLAGQVFRDSNIVPTRLANLWYAEDSLFAELSGGLFSGDPGRWSALLARLQGRGAGGFFRRIFPAKGDAQLRGLVLFCDIAPFLGVPDANRIGGISRRVQERLRVVGESFGTNFPVYVVFTKSDAIPYFSEYFSRLVENEDQQVLGCTLPGVAPGARTPGEVFAEAESARLADSFNSLYYSLADKRLDLLPREVNAPTRPAVYEFPRELKRIRDTLVQFLVDVFRPNPLQPGPILRGYYFTATRQVTVSALGPLAAAETPSARAAAGEATSLFNLADYQKKMGLVAETATGPAETTLERWCFVSELFHRVILPDPMGKAVAFANRRHDMQRRILFGVACFFAFLVAFLWMRSWWNNSGLLGDVSAAAKAPYSFQPGVRAIPSIDALREVDGLREQLQTLLDYDRNGAPWRMRWGLYSGKSALAALYDVYFQRFRQIFFDDIHSSILGTLSRLPASPDNQNTYNGTYDRLKSYRMITQGKCSVDPAFLSPVLADVWLSGRNIDPDRQALAVRQINFYASELKYKNPYKVAENGDAIARGQLYLSSFGGVDRLYRGIVEEANKAPHAPARLADLAPNYKQVLSSPGEVQAAFTRDGFAFVLAAIKDPSRLTLGEPCVLGATNIGAGLLQGAQVQTDLQNLYFQDYIKRWKDFVSSTSLLGFSNAGDAGKKLLVLADNRSPLLAAVFMIADNTNFPAPASQAPAAATGILNRIMPSNAKKALDTAKQLVPAGGAAMSPGDITKVFQPSREVVVVTDRDRLINDPNRNYMNALNDLQRAMDRLQDDRPSNPDMSLHDTARKASDAGLDAVRQISDRFNIASSQGVDTDIRRLLESPFREASKFIITDPSKAGRAGAGAAVKKFCDRLDPLRRLFPFNPESDKDAPVDQVSAIFAPQGSAFADMTQQLAKIVVKQGRQWAANPASQDVHPSAELLAFLNKMQSIQDALFAGGGQQMHMTYALRAVPDANEDAVTINIDGHSYTANRGGGQAQQFTWPGAGQVDVTVRAGGNIPFGAYPGPWAVFRWMYVSDPRQPGSKMAQWSTVRGQGRSLAQQPTDAKGAAIVVKVEITEFPAGVDVFDRNFFTIRCPIRAAE
jgi:type VI secretion system protein ImpL